MSSRLTRKEIKRDEVLETFGNVVHWVSDHLKLLVAGAGVLVLLALAGVAVAAHRARRAEEAQGELAQALRIHGAPVDPADADPADPRNPSFTDEAARRERSAEAFEAVRERFAGTDAAALAGVYLGRLAAAEGDLERARELWQAFVERRPRHALGLEIRVNLMELDRAEGRGEELAERLRASLADADDALPEDLVLDQLGRTLDQVGRPGESLEIYQRLLAEHPGSPFAAQASRRVEAIEAELEGS